MLNNNIILDEEQIIIEPIFMEKDRPTNMFPMDVPEKLLDFKNVLIEATELTGTSHEMCFMSAIANINQTCMAYGNIKAKKSDTPCPINLFFLNIAESGERKSTVDRLFSKGLRIYQKKLSVQYKHNLKKFEKDYEAWEKQSFSKEKYTEQTLEKPKKPEFSLISLDDFNIPSLKHTLETNEIPILSVNTNEGGMIFSSEFFKRNGSELMAVLNNLFDNDPLKKSTISRGKSIIENKRLSLFIQIQPKVWFDSLASSNFFVESGFSSRMLLCQPPERAGTTSQIIPEFEMEKKFDHLNKFTDRISSIFDRKMNRLTELDEEGLTTSINELDPQTFILTSTSYEEYRLFYNEISLERGISGKYRPINNFAAKIANISLRIACNLHLFYVGLDHDYIEKDIMQYSIKICRWFLEEHFYAIKAKSKNDSEPQIALILFDNLKKFTKGDVFKLNNILLNKLTKSEKKNINLRIKETAEKYIKILIAHNYIISYKDESYKINPFFIVS